jgi:hypothetical protein
METGCSSPAFASGKPECGNAAREQWLTEDAIRTKATELGYQVRRVEVDDNCYEVYAIGRDGAKVEAYFHPVSGALVRAKKDD